MRATPRNSQISNGTHAQHQFSLLPHRLIYGMKGAYLTSGVAKIYFTRSAGATTATPMHLGRKLTLESDAACPARRTGPVDSRTKRDASRDSRRTLPVLAISSTRNSAGEAALGGDGLMNGGQTRTRRCGVANIVVPDTVT